jgi:hypothetical protein
MFKSVEYDGFEGRPDLAAKARHATDVLGGVIRDWRDQLVVTWRPHSGAGAELELALALDLPEAHMTAAGRISARGFEPGEDAVLRMDVRDVWLDILDRLIAQVATRLDASFATPVEV